MKAMHGSRHLRFGARTLVVIGIVLIAGHLIVLYLLGHVGLSQGVVSGAVVSGLILVVVAKHLGLLSTLVASLYGLFRRRLRS